jgi:hypothetical protein
VSGFVKPHVGLNLFQRVFRDEKRSLHRAVISPKAHGAGIETAVALVGHLGEVGRARSIFAAETQALDDARRSKKSAPGAGASRSSSGHCSP